MSDRATRRGRAGVAHRISAGAATAKGGSRFKRLSQNVGAPSKLGGTEGAGILGQRLALGASMRLSRFFDLVSYRKVMLKQEKLKQGKLKRDKLERDKLERERLKQELLKGKPSLMIGDYMMPPPKSSRPSRPATTKQKMIKTKPKSIINVIADPTVDLGKRAASAGANPGEPLDARAVGSVMKTIAKSAVDLFGTAEGAMNYMGGDNFYSTGMSAHDLVANGRSTSVIARFDELRFGSQG